MFCPQCGKEVPAESRFCGLCGSKLGPAVTAAAPAVANANATTTPVTQPPRSASPGGQGIAWLVGLIVVVIVAALAFFFLRSSKTATESLLDMASAIISRDDAKFEKYLTAKNREFFERQFGSISHVPEVFKTASDGQDAAAPQLGIVVPFATLSPGDHVDPKAKTITQTFTAGNNQVQLVTTFQQERTFGKRAIVDGVNAISNPTSGKQNLSFNFRYILGQEDGIWKVECVFATVGGMPGGSFPEACPSLAEGKGVEEKGGVVSMVDMGSVWGEFTRNIVGARKSAHEAAAASTVRTLNTTEISYSTTYPTSGYASNLTMLGPGTSDTCSGGPDQNHACLIDATLGCASGAWCTKDAYRYIVVGIGSPATDYVVTATPVSEASGGKNFCSSADAVVRFGTGPPRSEPFSLAECQSMTPL